jgi:CheY-like chemotaxis protein
VLIVDDDEDIRNTITDILELRGYQVSAAADGREALERLRNGLRPGVILLDLMMPIMNGWEFLEATRGRAEIARIPVVVLSASHGGVGRHDVFSVLPKPVELDCLLATLSRAIPD